jgi:hypothetical protein
LKRVGWTFLLASHEVLLLDLRSIGPELQPVKLIKRGWAENSCGAGIYGVSRKSRANFWDQRPAGLCPGQRASVT